MRSINKRQKIILGSSLISVGLLLSQFVPFYLTYRFIFGLAVLSYLLSLWALWQGIDKLKAVILLILPTLFTVAVASYFFLLPLNLIIRLPVAAVFGIIFYTLLLSQNVFSVASIRTIPLYRVASTTVFVLTLITVYLLLNVLFSLNLLFIWNGLLVFALCFPLILHVMWSLEMEEITYMMITYSAVLALILAEVAIGLSFWPISKSLASLVTSTVLFITLGISSHTLRDRLSRGVIWEYLVWGIFIFLFAILTTSWRG